MEEYDYEYIVYVKDGKYYLNPECTIQDKKTVLINIMNKVQTPVNQTLEYINAKELDELEEDK